MSCTACMFEAQDSPKERYSSACRRWAHPVREANVP